MAAKPFQSTLSAAAANVLSRAHRLRIVVGRVTRSIAMRSARRMIARAMKIVAFQADQPVISRGDRNDHAI